MNINLNTVLALTIKKIFLPISSDDRQHVSRCIRRGLSDFEGHVPQVHDSKAHVLQHGQLLTWMQERDRRLSGRGVLPLFPWAQHGHRAGHGWGGDGIRRGCDQRGLLRASSPADSCLPAATFSNTAGGDSHHGSQPSAGEGQRGEGNHMHGSSEGRAGALEMDRDSHTAHCGQIPLLRGAWYLFEVL